MEIVNIILLEGVNIEEKDNSYIYLCHNYFTLLSPFPIQYLNPILQLVVKSRNEKNMNNPLMIGLGKKDDNYKSINIKLNDLSILSTVEGDIIYSCNGIKNRFPICWLNDNIKSLLV